MHYWVLRRSWTLALACMWQILFSFFPAYLIYYGVFQQRYIGMFQLLSVFIILGIGADDVYVISDTWTQTAGIISDYVKEKMHGVTVVNPASASPPPPQSHASLLSRKNGDLTWVRLSKMWKRASKATLVTSLTTMASFLSNATSGFPAISTFGIFAAALVLSIYSSSIIFYATSITCHHRYLSRFAFCCGMCPRSCCKPPEEEEKAIAAEQLTDIEMVSAGAKPPKAAAPGPSFSHDNPLSRSVTASKKNGKKKKSGKKKPYQASSSSETSPRNNAGSSADSRSEQPQEDLDEDHNHLGAIERWFRTKYYPFLSRFWWIMLIVNAIIIGVMIGFATGLEPDPEVPQVCMLQLDAACCTTPHTRLGNRFCQMITLTKAIAMPFPIITCAALGEACFMLASTSFAPYQLPPSSLAQPLCLDGLACVWHQP